MKRSVKRLLSLVCVVAIGATMMTSCKKNPADQTSSDDYEIEYIYESEETGGNETEANASTNQNTNSNSSNTTSGKKPTASTGNTGTSGGNDLSKYKGTTVTYASWIDPAKAEEAAAIKKFEKETGMKFKYMNVPQSDYINTIVGKINAGSAPDVVFDNGFYPASLNILQPISVAETVDLSDPLWDQSYMKHFTFKGEVYELSSVSNFWAETKVFFYNKSLIKTAGVPTPEELYNQGNWTWESLGNLMKMYDESPTKPRGTTAMSGVSPGAMLESIGCGFFVYDEQTATIKNGTSDPLCVQALTKLCEWSKLGYSTGDGDAFINGKSAMTPGGCYGLRKKGQFKKMANQSDIGFVRMPTYDANSKRVYTYASRGQGICKGSKNPGGAGIFLKYYLDPANYDYASEYISNDALNFFREITAEKAASDNTFFSIYEGVITANGLEGNGVDYWMFVTTDPTQVDRALKSMNNVNNARATEATKVLQNAIK